MLMKLKLVNKSEAMLANESEAELCDILELAMATATPTSLASSALGSFVNAGRFDLSKLQVVNLVLQVEKKSFVEAVNATFSEAARGILAVYDEPHVSMGLSYSNGSSTIDSSLTKVRGDDMVKVVARYDNEWTCKVLRVSLSKTAVGVWPACIMDPFKPVCRHSPFP
ncbi:hypothetical protein L7F22_011669 [Adiantum nelumboides]|nr:hypothetical protein [Adiantum nelumboides]